mmetsp:Transcript_48169/g.148682  ORF Transcript_48169/g.148682 Transcript_48169/m.148682 type:complete len:455 (-) Transcript_48169:320-1684(-)
MHGGPRRLRRPLLDQGREQVHEAADRAGDVPRQLLPAVAAGSLQGRRARLQDVALAGRPPLHDAAERPGARPLQVLHVQLPGGEARAQERGVRRAVRADRRALVLQGGGGRRHDDGGLRQRLARLPAPPQHGRLPRGGRVRRLPGVQLLRQGRLRPVHRQGLHALRPRRVHHRERADARRAPVQEVLRALPHPEPQRDEVRLLAGGEPAGAGGRDGPAGCLLEDVQSRGLRRLECARCAHGRQEVLRPDLAEDHLWCHRHLLPRGLLRPDDLHRGRGQAHKPPVHPHEKRQEDQHRGLHQGYRYETELQGRQAAWHQGGRRRLDQRRPAEVRPARGQGRAGQELWLLQRGARLCAQRPDVQLVPRLARGLVGRPRQVAQKQGGRVAGLRDAGHVRAAHGHGAEREPPWTGRQNGRGRLAQGQETVGVAPPRGLPCRVRQRVGIVYRVLQEAQHG